MGSIKRRRLSSESQLIESQPILMVPAALRSFFEPHLLKDEDPQSYWALFKLIVEEIGPRDMMEWLWSRDVVNTSWEMNRNSRMKPALLDAGRRTAVVGLCTPLGEATSDDVKFRAACEEAQELGEKWVNLATRKQAEVRLGKRGVDRAAIDATSWGLQINTLESAERLLTILEVRRNRALQQLEDRRQTRAMLGFVNSEPPVG